MIIFMKKILSLLTLVTTLLLAKPLTTTQAISHIGEYATVCGKAVGSYYAERSNGQPTFINLDKRYPNQLFTIIIWGDDRDRFQSPESTYIHKRICVTGTINSYRGIAQIIVRDPSQIKK